MEAPPTLTRQYSADDTNSLPNIHNGRCPEYALYWSHEQNKQHWPPGHDYYLGNNQNLNKQTEKIRRILSKKLSEGNPSNISTQNLIIPNEKEKEKND
jgi:hypothetical protein